MAIGDDTFDDWASETTQKEIQKLLETKLKAYDAKKIEDFLKKIEENTKALKDSKGAGGVDFTQSLKAAGLKSAAGGSSRPPGGGGASTSSSVVATLMEGMKKTARPSATVGGQGGGGGPIGEVRKQEISAVKTTTSSLFNFTRTLSKSTLGVLSFVGIMGALGRLVAGTIDAYRDLTDVGQRFGGSMLEMRKQATEMAMGFDEFVKVMTVHATTINAVGTQEFIKLQRRTREINKHFGMFGLSLAENANFLGDFLEQSIRLGNHQRLNSEQQSLGFKDYMIELTMLADATGRSRREMAKSVTDTSKSFDIYMAQLGMTAEQQTTFRKGMDQIKVGMQAAGPEMANMLGEALSSQIRTGNIGMSTLGRVASFASAEMRESLESLFTRIRAGGPDAQLAMAEFNDAVRSKDFKEAINRAHLANIEGVEAVARAAQPMIQMHQDQFDETQKVLRATKQEREAREKEIADKNAGTQELLKVQELWNTTIGDLQNTILLELKPYLIELGEWLKENKGTIKEWMGTLVYWLKLIIKNFEWLVGAFIAIKAVGIASTLLNFGKAVGATGGIMGGIGKGLAKMAPAVATGATAILGPLAAIGSVATGVAMVGKDAIDIVSAATSDKKDVKGEDVGGVGGGLAGAAAGALAGAAIGTAVPVIGNILGALIGGGIGAMGGNLTGGWLGGLFDDDDAAEEKKIKDTKANIKNVSAENMQKAKVEQAQAAQRTAIETKGEETAIVDPVDRMNGLLKKAVTLNEDMLKELTEMNNRAEIAQSQREMQIREQKKMGRNPNVGLSVTG